MKNCDQFKASKLPARPERLHFVEIIAILLGLAVAVLMICGCLPSKHIASVPDSLPAAGSAIARADAHVESAERMNSAAKPLAGKEALPLLNQQTHEHVAAKAAMGDADRALGKANAQREALALENFKQAITITKITCSIGYQIQLWVTRAFWSIAAVFGLHIVLGWLALCISGPAGGIIARVALYLNPAAWFQSARDNYYFRVQAPKAA